MVLICRALGGGGGWWSRAGFLYRDPPHFASYGTGTGRGTDLGACAAHEALGCHLQRHRSVKLETRFSSLRSPQLLPCPHPTAPHFGCGNFGLVTLTISYARRTQYNRDNGTTNLSSTLSLSRADTSQSREYPTCGRFPRPGEQGSSPSLLRCLPSRSDTTTNSRSPIAIFWATTVGSIIHSCGRKRSGK